MAIWVVTWPIVTSIMVAAVMMTMVNEWRKKMTKISLMAMKTTVNGLAKEIGETTMIAMQAMVNGGAKNTHVILMATKAMANGDVDCGEVTEDDF
jgi:hypothetical protein